MMEWSYISSKQYGNPFLDVALHAKVVQPDGTTIIIPGFWAGENIWKLRYSSSQLGEHHLITICSDPKNDGLHGYQDTLHVDLYKGSNPLYVHGGLQKADNGRYLQHEDGTPFFWLGDTWWMGFTSRLQWPEGFETLAADRIEKGFTVVQIVAGLYPDMDPFDDRGANEAGLPWDTDFKSIRPEYFDMADLKIAHLVHSGLVPCLVGCWGFFLEFAGQAVIEQHWDYLLARYGAYPVVWCMAGEALMRFYTNKATGNTEKTNDEYKVWARKGWTDITRRIKEADPYHRPITIHPTQYGHEMVDDESLLDLDMLQTGHSSFHSLSPTVSMVRKAVNRETALPVIDSEVCYEGICGTSYQEIQRFTFWSCMLTGACGHTYGANGIWQMNTKEKPYGPSPHGATWGNTPWDEAYRLPGSRQVGIGKKFLSKFRWWEFTSHPEWIMKHAVDDQNIAAFASGIPGQVRVIFLPFLAGFGWGQTTIKEIEQDIQYRAYYFDPIEGKEYDLGLVKSDQKGEWISGKVTIFQDWVLVLEKV